MDHLGRSAAVALGLASALWLASAKAQVAGPTSHGNAAAAVRDSEVSPAGRAGATAAAPGGADGGAGSYGKAGDPYSQAGYGKGAFGNGRPSPVR